LAYYHKKLNSLRADLKREKNFKDPDQETIKEIEDEIKELNLKFNTNFKGVKDVLPTDMEIASIAFSVSYDYPNDPIKAVQEVTRRLTQLYHLTSSEIDKLLPKFKMAFSMYKVNHDSKSKDDQNSYHQIEFIKQIAKNYYNLMLNDVEATQIFEDALSQGRDVYEAIKFSISNFKNKNNTRDAFEERREAEVLERVLREIDAAKTDAIEVGGQAVWGRIKSAIMRNL
jgi:hypothetical protein